MKTQDGPKIVQGMVKGLECLEAVNSHESLTSAQCAVIVGLPRTTTFRALETLRKNGYLERDHDGAYRATARVQALSCGFRESAWVKEIVEPELRNLADRVRWAVGFLVPHGAALRIVATTDSKNPLCINRIFAGAKLPVLGNAAGHLYLASLDPARRSALLDVCGETSGVADMADFDRYLDGVQRRGFARTPSNRSDQEHILAVPVTRNGEFVGACGMKYIARALSPDEVERRYLPLLFAAAARIAEGLSGPH